MALQVRLWIPVAIFLLLFAQLRPESSAETAQRVNRAIQELDSEDFAVRSAATQTLKGIGQPAIEPLMTAALEGDLEITDRAVQVLTSYYRLEEKAALDQLDTAMEKLADSDRPSAARRAAAAIQLHAAGREERALEKLQKYQAIIGSINRNGEMSFVDLTGPLHIWIDDQWQGGDSGLKLFRRLSSVEQLYRVEGCPAALDAVRKLEQIIPNLTVQERGDAYLGLQAGEAQNKGFLIAKVSPRGSIDAAGLQMNDVIIGYAGKQVDNFHQLVELIKQNKVGDTVKVDYLRDGEHRTADVKLKSWREVFEEEQKLQAEKRDRERRSSNQPLPENSEPAK